MTTSNESLISSILDIFGFSSLNSIQSDAINNGLLEGNSLLISSPTSSGKTLIALLASLKTIDKNFKVIYVVPLKALAAEKYEDFKILKSYMNGVSIGILSGDISERGSNYQNDNILIMTYEKLDSLMRHNTNWLKQVRLFVIDEIHIIGDRQRGPILEMILAKILNLYSNAQILGLSATITNADELSDWLKCKLVKSSWRPIELIEGVYHNCKIYFNNELSSSVNYNSSFKAIDVAMDGIDRGGQSLIFADTRKKALSLAKVASVPLSKRLSREAKESCIKMAKKISRNHDDDLSLLLSNIISNGVAFHHAGLSPYCRHIVEDSFKNRIIKLLIATPTLSSGVNLPARRVIISSIHRYDYESQSIIPISVAEYKQLCGRAGRPQYDSCGEAIIIPGQYPVRDIVDRYIKGSPEPIQSQFTEKSLRIHVLSLIVSVPGLKKINIYAFFTNTLFCRQNTKTIVYFKIDVILNFLLLENFIVLRDESYYSTHIGTRTCLLYLDPLTVIEFNNKLKHLPKSTNKRYTLGMLHVITDSTDFYPKLLFRNDDYLNFKKILNTYYEELFYHVDEFSCNKSMWALYGWINEYSYKQLNNELGVEPGDVYKIIESSEWLCYSLCSIASLLHHDNYNEFFKELLIRIKYGVKSDLISLIDIPDIGRIRARVLHNAGYISKERIRNSSDSELYKLPGFGRSLIRKIRKYIN